MRTLLAIGKKYREPSFWEVMDSCFLSICKFGNFKNPLSMIISLFELYFGLRRPILLVQTKELISMSCGSREGSSKPWRFDLKFALRDIYINSNLHSLTKFTSNNRSTKFKDSLSRNISQIIMKIVLISTKTETTT